MAHCRESSVFMASKPRLPQGPLKTPRRGCPPFAEAGRLRTAPCQERRSLLHRTRWTTVIPAHAGTQSGCVRICAVFHVLSSTGIRKRRNTKAKPLDSGQSLPPRSALIAGMTTIIKSAAGTGPRACPGVGVSTLASFARQLLCRGGSRTAPQAR